MSANQARGRELAKASALGVAAGLVGVAVMTVGEKAEQALIPTRSHEPLTTAPKVSSLIRVDVPTYQRA